MRASVNAQSVSLNMYNREALPHPVHACSVARSCLLKPTHPHARAPARPTQFLTPVPLWELKHIRKLSHLCAISYKLPTVTRQALRRKHGLELVVASWACDAELAAEAEVGASFVAFMAMLRCKHMALSCWRLASLACDAELAAVGRGGCIIRIIYGHAAVQATCLKLVVASWACNAGLHRWLCTLAASTVMELGQCIT